jgi:hypothetical protein
MTFQNRGHTVTPPPFIECTRFISTQGQYVIFGLPKQESELPKAARFMEFELHEAKSLDAKPCSTWWANHPSPVSITNVFSSRIKIAKYLW